MNRFATIKLVERYKKVNYYTLELDGKNLFGDFITRHTFKSKRKLNHILSWIKLIGEQYGAWDYYFRPEAETADTAALPPQGEDREPTYIEFNDATGKEESTANNLRLYCFRANEHVVFLFNGDIKTAAKAQDCDNVRPYFKEANELTAEIEKAFGDEINWNDDYTDILFDEDVELNC